MKKKAPEKIKRENAIQYCIDAYLVEDVLPLVKQVAIIGCRIRFGMPISRRKIPVPAKLRKFGVSRMSEIRAGLEAEIVLDQVTQSTIMRAVKEVARAIGTDPASAQFKYITLADKSASAKFDIVTKEMKPRKDEEAVDLRRKARVLGLHDGKGKVNSLCAKIGADKFRCDIETIAEKKIVLCRKVV